MAWLAIDAAHGYCQANPPVVTHGIRRASNDVDDFQYPIVAASAWCGRWKVIGGGSVGNLEEWIVGDGLPSNVIGSDGDLYLDSQTGNVYEKVNGSWS